MFQCPCVCFFGDDRFFARGTTLHYPTLPCICTSFFFSRSLRGHHEDLCCTAPPERFGSTTLWSYPALPCIIPHYTPFFPVPSIVHDPIQQFYVVNISVDHIQREQTPKPSQEKSPTRLRQIPNNTAPTRSFPSSLFVSSFSVPRRRLLQTAPTTLLRGP